MTFSSSLYVPGPAVLHERVQGGLWDLGLRTAVVTRILREEVTHQRRNLFSTVPKRRNRDAHDVQAEEEILAEQTRSRPPLPAAGLRSDHAHVDAHVTLPSEPRKLAVLQDVQQLRLKGRRHLADFIEEDGAVIGELELAWFRLEGSAERASLEPEHFRFQQLAWERGTVDLHEGLVATR